MAHQALCGGETSILYSSELVEGRILDCNCFLLWGCAWREDLAKRTPKISSGSQPAEEADQ
jgi:hypothetical protein